MKLNDNVNEYINNILGYECESLLFDYGHISDGPVAKICRAAIAKQVNFDDKNIWDEDTIWNLKIATLCKNIWVSRNIWYLYFMNESSQTHIFRENCLSEFEYRIGQELNLVKELWPDCMTGVYTRIWSNTYLLFDTFLIHKDNMLSFKNKYKAYLYAIRQKAYKEMLKYIRFDNEKIFYKRSIKFLLRWLALYGPKLFSYFGWCFLLKVRKGLH